MKKTEMPPGEHEWLTVLAGDDEDGPGLLSEPISFEPARICQKALCEAGISSNMFNVAGIRKERRRLIDLGVDRTGKPDAMGIVTVAVFNDTRGNNIQMIRI